MVWNQSQALRVTPSSLIGLTPGSYEAYCFDQAIWYYGSTVTVALENAGRKKQKGEAQLEAARKKVLAKFLDDDPEQTQQFADPALIFGLK